MRFMSEEEASRTMSLFEGASESHRISKSSLKNWVVRNQIILYKQLIHSFDVSTSILW